MLKLKKSFTTNIISIIAIASICFICIPEAYPNNGPSTRESYLRKSMDYNGESEASDRFKSVAQKLRAGKTSELQEIKLVASLIEVPNDEFEERLDQAIEGGADEFHADIIDGIFHPRTIKDEGLRRLRVYKEKAFYIPSTAHLMVDDPLGKTLSSTGKNYIESCAEVDVNMVLIHLKAFRGNLSYLKTTVDAIKDNGMRVGLVLNPDEYLDSGLESKILPFIDRLTVMGVWPGAGGQAFLPDTLKRAKQVVDRLRELRLSDKIEVEIDGGLRSEFVKKGAEIGVNVFSGWSLYTINGTPIQNIPKIRALCKGILNPVASPKKNFHPKIYKEVSRFN